jgi:predicted ATP-dependent endonuclease of OLD family
VYYSLAIENYRCFINFGIEDFKRINLITGRNGAGKTTLLEAIWLHNAPNIPDLVRRVDVFRGKSEIDLDSPFGDIFAGFDVGKTIRLAAHGNWGQGQHILRIFLENRKEADVRLSEPNLESIMERSTVPIRASGQQIVFEYEGDTDGKVISYAWVEERQVAIAVRQLTLISQQSALKVHQTGVFLPANRRIGKEDLDRFSKVEVDMKQEAVVKILQLVEPRIKRLSVIVKEGVPALYADIGSEQLVPFELLGDGINRLLSIGLAISNAAGGIVLVDEIENGIYYAARAQIWKGIASFANTFDVQVFATTHSRECIEAAYQAFSQDDPFDFRLYRLERAPDGVRAFTYDRETLIAALESGLEVR